jgi:SAM-dependent methyltransferase
VNTHPNLKNIRAWDQLYQNSVGKIWGHIPLPFFFEWMETLKDLNLERTRILDAGTGEGRNLPALLDLQSEVYACDASRHALKRISDPVRACVHLKCCELSATPYPEHHFRLVAMLDVFETLPSIGSVLNELHRILDDDGHLFVNIPDDSDPISSTDMIPLEDGGYMYRGKYYYHFYSRAKAVEILRSSGFEVVTQQRHTWEEAPHENYRSNAHTHTSCVFLLKKTNL